MLKNIKYIELKWWGQHPPYMANVIVNKYTQKKKYFLHLNKACNS